MLSIGLLIWLFGRQDWGELRKLAKSIPLATLLLSMILLYARVFFHTLRWMVLLRAQSINIGIRRALGLQMAGLFASNFLPSTVGGDFARFVGVIPETKNRVAGAASIVVDRAMGVIGMLFVLPLGLPLLGDLVNGLAIGSIGSRWSIPNPIRDALVRLREALSLWASRPSSLGLALIASWAGILSSLLSILLVARGLAIPVDFAEVAGATALTYFVTLIPLSINAYGVRELGVLALYTQLGATPEQAAALAIITRTLQLLTSLPGALGLRRILRG